MGALDDLLSFTDPNKKREREKPAGALADLLDQTDPNREDKQSGFVDTGHTIARGALDTGVGSTLEGVSRMVQAADADFFPREKAEAEAADRLSQLSTEKFGMLDPREPRMGTRPDEYRGFEREPKITPRKAERLAELDTQIPAARAALQAEQTKRLKKSKASEYAENVSDFRQAVRDVYPVDKDFEQSTYGGVVSGVSQMVSMIPHTSPASDYRRRQARYLTEAIRTRRAAAPTR
jgi:hypothetical protein